MAETSEAALRDTRRFPESQGNLDSAREIYAVRLYYTISAKLLILVLDIGYCYVNITICHFLLRYNY